MWKQKGAAASRVLGLVEVSAADEELIRRTLKLVRTRNSWTVSRTDRADLVLVDVDRQPGRSRWWSLRRDEHCRAVVPLTARRELLALQPLLLRPICGHTLAGMLDRCEEIKAGVFARAVPSRHERFLLEAIMASPWSRFTVHIEPGNGRYLFDFGHDRLYADGEEDALRKRLFRSVDGATIQPSATFVYSPRSPAEAVHLRLSAWLAEAVLASGRVDGLHVFQGNPVVALDGDFDLEAIRLDRNLYPILCVLATHGPLELLELILSSGHSRREVCAVLAALWISRRLRVEHPAGAKPERAAQGVGRRFLTGPRLAL